MPKYQDIIHLEHFNPKNHPRMSIANRSAIFAPFSALAGYKEEIMEIARMVDKKRELSCDEKEILNEKIIYIKNNLSNINEVTITYFIPDMRKKGGKYITITNYIKRIDEVKKEIIMIDNTKILIDRIIDIE